MKDKTNMIKEFQVEELESRYEMKIWVALYMCEAKPELCPELPH